QRIRKTHMCTRKINSRIKKSLANSVTNSVRLCFFFSSRRRHTRFKCDWSSDVCSSDLMLNNFVVEHSLGTITKRKNIQPITARRSEERRVGKEYRTRWARIHKKKKTEMTKEDGRTQIATST